MSGAAQPSPQDPSHAGTDLPRNSPLLAFTWNVKGNADLLQIACKHLAQQGTCVACFQEVPADFDAAEILVWSSNRLKSLTRPVPAPHKSKPEHMVDPHVLIVASDDISPDPLGPRHEWEAILDSERRLEGVTLASASWSDLAVLGVHGWDRRYRPSESDRADWSQLVRGVLGSFWNNARPLIVLGDFNANPWDREITCRSGFFALREKDWPMKEDVKLHNVERYVTPLYNPMWLLLPDVPGGRGSHYYPNRDDVRWHCFDQILVSEHLKNVCAPPTLLTEMCEQPLAKNTGYCNPIRGDHLPVQMMINIGQVESCRR